MTPSTPILQPDAQVTTAELRDGLFVLELEERLELATLSAAPSDCQRCDPFIIVL